jgi:hypothetical protein
MYDADIQNSLLSVETVFSRSIFEMSRVSYFELSRSIRNDLRNFFGDISSDIRVFVGEIPYMLQASAFSEGRNVVIDKAVLLKEPREFLSTLAHEFAHAIQQRCHWESTIAGTALVHDRALENEANLVASRFLRGEGVPKLTTIAPGSNSSRIVAQCQQFGQLGAYTLNQPRNWQGPAQGPVQYAAVNCRNEIWANRATAHSRAKALAGVEANRNARRTYHFFSDGAHNEGWLVSSTIGADQVDPARRGRYYDFGRGPRGSLLIVEHTNDQNAVVTVHNMAAPRAHFHICTYGQHLFFERALDAGRKWQPFDPTVMYLPFYTVPAERAEDRYKTNEGPREYELDGRFGEAGQYGKNEHHIYYL